MYNKINTTPTLSVSVINQHDDTEQITCLLNFAFGFVLL
jgi:hypothetical protein